MGGERKIDRADEVKETPARTDDPLAQARTDHVPAAFQTKKDTGSYDLHELHVGGAESLPGIGANITDKDLRARHDFKETGSREVNGETVKTYEGQLADGYVRDTKVKMEETIGADGKVSELKIHYSDGQFIGIKAADDKGSGALAISGVKDVTLIPQEDGKTLMKINPPQGGLLQPRFDTVILDADGKVLNSCNSKGPNYENTLVAYDVKDRQTN